MTFFKTLSKIVLASVLACLTLTKPVLAADNWPSGPVKLVVPIDVGVAQDVLARRLAHELQSIWGRTVNVINQPGAAGTLGTLTVANSTPDGHTIGLISATFTGTFATRHDLPYTRDKLHGIIKFGLQDFFIFARAGAPFNNAREMISFAKTNPGKLSFASPGIGSYVHITMEHLMMLQNLNMIHVPYRNLQQALPDIMGDRLDLLLTTANPGIAGLIAKGDIKVIGSLGDNATHLGKPVESISKVDAKVSAHGYYALIVPQGTSQTIIDKIQRDVISIVNKSEFRQQMLVLGTRPSIDLEFDRWIDQEVARLKTTVKQANIKVQ
jgi:tripartite-type tricarboxylate transporter receptor subunit TctC